VAIADRWFQQPNLFCTEEVVQCPDKKTFVGQKSVENDCQLELCPDAACVYFDEPSGASFDKSSLCANGFECKKFKGISTGGSISKTCQPESTCEVGEEWDRSVGECVAVSCESKLACAKSKGVCESNPVQCIMAPCPQFKCTERKCEVGDSKKVSTTVMCKGHPTKEQTVVIESCDCVDEDGTPDWLCMVAGMVPEDMFCCDAEQDEIFVKGKCVSKKCALADCQPIRCKSNQKLFQVGDAL
jgi:hypothetical protein